MLLLHLRADPAMGDALRTAIHHITGVTLPVPPPHVPTEPPPVSPPGVPVPPPAPQPGAPPPEPPPPPGPAAGVPLPTRYGTAPQELADAIRHYWPADQWTSAAEISRLESGWSRTALADTTAAHGPCGTRYYIPSLGIWAQSEISAGWFQINVCAHGSNVEYWYDTHHNVSKAADLYHSAGDRYTPWLVSAGKLGLPV